MSLTTTQHDILVKYLKDVGIRNQEPFEEFYDHIVTAFEKSDAADIRLFIKEVIEPAFGGEKGIQKILKEGSKSVTRHYRKVLRRRIISYFNGYLVVIPLSLFLLIYLSFTLAEPKKILAWILIVTSTQPMVFSIYLFLKFKIHSKRNKTQFKPSLKHEELHRLSVIGLFTLILHNILLLDMDTNRLNEWLITWLPIVAISFTFFCLLSLSYIRLMKEEIVPKLIIQ